MVDVLALQLASFFTRASQSDLRDVFRLFLPSQFEVPNWRAKRWNDALKKEEMYVSPQECWSYIGRYSWAHGTGGSIDKSSAVNAFDFAWVIPWTLTVYDESHSMSSHGIKKVSNCNELLVTYSFHILVDSKVRLTTGILIIYWKVTKRTNKKKEYSECTSLGLFPSALMVFIVSHAIHVISQHQETFVLAS